MGFEKDLIETNAKMLVQDPLEEIDIGDVTSKHPIYISATFDPELMNEVIQLLEKYKDCFACDYDEMCGLR